MSPPLRWARRSDASPRTTAARPSLALVPRLLAHAAPPHATVPTAARHPLVPLLAGVLPPPLLPTLSPPLPTRGPRAHQTTTL